MSSRKAVTLMEMLIVIIIIGIFATIGIGYFNQSSESVYDKEARAVLKLIRAAEQIYRIDTSTYFPPTGTATTAAINTQLKVGISTNSKWNYTVDANGCSEATFGTKTWHITIGDPDSEPDSGACP